MKLIAAIILFGFYEMAPAQNPVVVELFTSQGCSSCPAADKNLAEIVDAAEKNNQPIIGLSFHVDYWNYIGWKDPYSKKEFTERQYRYASLMNSNNVYTPQMIVNGRYEFVGSNEKMVAGIIEDAVKLKMPNQIMITEIKNNGTTLTIYYAIDKSPGANDIINAAIVESSTANIVTRGENVGKRLSHRNVVRSFYTSKALKEASIEINLPGSISKASVVLYLQNAQWRITGAAVSGIDKMTK